MGGRSRAGGAAALAQRAGAASGGCVSRCAAGAGARRGPLASARQRAAHGLDIARQTLGGPPCPHRAAARPPALQASTPSTTRGTSSAAARACWASSTKPPGAPSPLTTTAAPSRSKSCPPVRQRSERATPTALPSSSRRRTARRGPQAAERTHCLTAPLVARLELELPGRRGDRDEGSAKGRARCARAVAAGRRQASSLSRPPQTAPVTSSSSRVVCFLRARRHQPDAVPGRLHVGRVQVAARRAAGSVQRADGAGGRGRHGLVQGH